MPAMINGTLMMFEPCGDLINFTTYCRSRGRKRFFLMRDQLIRWIRSASGSRYCERDCGNVLILERRKTSVEMRIYWLSACDGMVTGIVETFGLPLTLLADLAGLDDQDHEGTVRYLHYERPAKRVLDFSRAAHVIQKIRQDRQSRRALSKAIRDNFRYKDCGIIRFTGDFVPKSFGFEEIGGWGTSGGLILHKSIKRRGDAEFPYVYYGVHT